MLPTGDLPSGMPESLHVSEVLLQAQLLHAELRPEGVCSGVCCSGSGHMRRACSVCSGVRSGSSHVRSAGSGLCASSCDLRGSRSRGLLPGSCHMRGSGSGSLLPGPRDLCGSGSSSGQVLRYALPGQVLRHRLQDRMQHELLPEDLLCRSLRSGPLDL